MSNFKVISRTIGPILLMEAAFMLPSLFICLYDGEPMVALCFVASMLIVALAGGSMTFFSRKEKASLMAHEGFVIVALSWILMSIFGALPFWFSGQIPSYIDALFETISGFTTTGASILPEVESLSRGILYWRSFTHWVGGMGMLVFALAVVPGNKKSGGTLYLMRAESPGPDVGKMTPRVHQTATILYGLYVLLTVVCFICLLAGGMPLFDSVCTAFGTAGTGGFGIKNDSLVSYAPHLQTTCTIFMLLFGINFNLYYLLLLGQIRDIFKDEELKLYLGIVATATLLITLDVRTLFDSIGEALHHSVFSVATIITTTGFATADFDQWPSFSKTIILLLMIVGASAGSTGGGMKVSRMLLMVRDLKTNISRTLRPRSVQVVHMNGRPVNDNVLHGLSAYVAAYWLLIGLSLIMISLDEQSLETNISAVISCFNNIGPGFAAVGPMCNYAQLSNLSKIVLSMDMLLGRLEIFPILALFSGNAWQSRRKWKA